MKDTFLENETKNLHERNLEYWKKAAELKKGQNELKTQKTLERLKHSWQRHVISLGNLQKNQRAIRGVWN